MTKFSIAMVALIGMAGLAAAGDPKADPKAGAPKADSKMAPKADPKMDKAAPPMMAMKAPQEVADMAKGMVGTWKCKGSAMGKDMKMADMTATMTPKLETGGWWIHDTFDAKSAGKDSEHFEAYTTFDKSSKKWKRVMVFRDGGWASGESAGMTAGKMDWDLAMHGPMGDMMFKDHLDISDAKVGVKSWGEASMDTGKTWMKVYEETCKK